MLKKSSSRVNKTSSQTRLNASSPSAAETNCTVFFVKYPEKGAVKNRLAIDLNGVEILELYRNFVLDLIAMLEKIRISFRICYFPENAEKRFIDWLGNQYHYVPQQGENLGERMHNSFVQAFRQGFQRVIAIGSDSPDLPRTFIEEAFFALRTMDSVIGPAYDGGYYLIGFRKETFFPDVFTGISWSTDKVFEESLARLENAGHKTSVLPPWHDVDTVSDLKELIQRSKNNSFEYSKTMSFLMSDNLCRFISTHEKNSQ